jgi:hypothetical protein
MNAQNGENLRELFESFGGGEATQEAVEDISRGVQILREHPAPEPRRQLIAKIEGQVAGALAEKKRKAFRRAVYRVAAVAAAFIVVAVASVKLLQPPTDKTEQIYSASIIPTAIWESDDIADDDADLALLRAEVNEIRQQMLALQRGENGGNGVDELAELELELVEINGVFWKG